jgi:2-polyprenyl-3-methyl-5-hydroxy-6-metoxy-1,4-benzoquinol methylase
MENLWDNRFKAKEYVYGTLPNVFFKTTIDKYNLKGKILLPAEGEGRNAVYAAQKGMDVYAFDTSIEGKNKAMKLAKRHHVSINYEVGDFFELELINKRFDVVALIYAHFSPDILSVYHKKLAELLKPNGMIIIEGFSKNHIENQKTNPTAGGPKNLEMLFSVDTMKRDFPNFEIIKLEETEEYLEEGQFHKGKAKLIQFIGRKRVQ